MRIGLLLLCIPLITMGQTAFNPNLLPLGDEEALMANTGTGRMGSTGAVFYNPAALSSLEGSAFSLSGSAYTLSYFEASPLDVVNGVPLNYSGWGYQTIPTSIIMARRFGEWRVAFSVLIPMQFRIEGSEDWLIEQGLPDVLDIRVTQYYREKMSLTGLTIAKPIDDKWSWGLSLFSQYYTYTSQLDLTAEFQNSTDFYFRNNSRTRLNPTNLLIVAGVHRKGEKVDWGLRLSLPSIHIFGRGEYFYELYERIPGQPVQREQVATGRVKARFITPLDIRVGMQYRISEDWNGGFDLSYGNNVEYSVFDSPEVDLREQVKNSFRISTGWERVFSPKLSGFAGISFMPTDLSTNDGLTADSFQYSSVSLGGKFSTEHVRTSLGVYYAVGQTNRSRELGPEVWRESYSYLGGFIGTQYTF